MRFLSKLDLQEWQHYKKKINRKLEKEKFIDRRLGKAMRERGKKRGIRMLMFILVICSWVYVVRFQSEWQVIKTNLTTLLLHWFTYWHFDSMAHWLMTHWLFCCLDGWAGGWLRESVISSRIISIHTHLFNIWCQEKLIWPNLNPKHL